jgi:hypothetical protein
MLKGAIPTTRMVTITAIEHHHQSQFKMLSRQRHQFKENSPFATQAPKVALTQSHQVAGKIIKGANQLFSSN